MSEQLIEAALWGEQREKKMKRKKKRIEVERVLDLGAQRLETLGWGQLHRPSPGR